MHTPAYDSLTVHRHVDRVSMGSAAANGVMDAINQACAERGEARVVFACAPSQDTFLDALVRLPIDWTRVVVFHMDEYASLAPDHPQSFRSFLRTHLLSRIERPKHVHLLAAEGAPLLEAARYAGLLAERPLDLVCMGIGENGHLAFNDPPVADFDDPLAVKVVALDATCRQQQVNDGCFPHLEAVPAEALTLTIPTLLSARTISCVVPGSRKAEAVRNTLLGPISTACPASILRRHPQGSLFIDEAAAALLPGAAGGQP